MSTTAVLEPVTTIKTYLRPIDGTGLAAFAAKGKANPASRGTNKVHTVMEGQYRSLSTVGNHAPVVVDEPLHLFGQRFKLRLGDSDLPDSFVLTVHNRLLNGR